MRKVHFAALTRQGGTYQLSSQFIVDRHLAI